MSTYNRAYNLDFEWDEEKAKENLEKHDVDFADAATVFSDTMALTIPDPASEEADRFVTLEPTHSNGCCSSRTRGARIGF
jgi:uncharacterized DUF497 family protein